MRGMAFGPGRSIGKSHGFDTNPVRNQHRSDGGAAKPLKSIGQVETQSYMELLAVDPEPPPMLRMGTSWSCGLPCGRTLVGARPMKGRSVLLHLRFAMDSAGLKPLKGSNGKVQHIPCTAARFGPHRRRNQPAHRPMQVPQFGFSCSPSDLPASTVPFPRPPQHLQSGLRLSGFSIRFEIARSGSAESDRLASLIACQVRQKKILVISS